MRAPLADCVFGATAISPCSPAILPLVRTYGCLRGSTPANRHVVLGLVGAPDVVEVAEWYLYRRRDTVELRHLVRRANR